MAWGGPNRPAARIALWFVAAYCVCLGFVGFWPTLIDRPAAGTIAGFLQFLHANGVPHWVNYRLIEFSANILLFAPLGVLLAAVLKPKRWWIAVTIGFAVSVGLEAGQFVLLSERYPSGWDLLANTAGAFIGALLVVIWRVRQGATP